MKVKRTEQIYIGKDGNVSELCHLSKNLFNQTNESVPFVPVRPLP
ncbi:MAG: hypothetical protein ACYDBI_06695 [Thermoplasmataceae archaeon]